MKPCSLVQFVTYDSAACSINVYLDYVCSSLAGFSETLLDKYLISQKRNDIRLKNVFPLFFFILQKKKFVSCSTMQSTSTF